MRRGIDLDEVTVIDDPAHAFAVSTVRGDEGGEYDHPRFHEKFSHFANAADVFFAVLGLEKPKSPHKPVAHIVAIQHEGVAPLLMQGFFNSMGQRRFARSGQPGEPDDCTAMASFALRGAHG